MPRRLGPRRSLGSQSLEPAAATFSCGASMAAKFKKGDEIVMRGTVKLVHDEEYGRRRVTGRLQGFDYPLTVSDEFVDLVGRPENPAAAKNPGMARGSLRRDGLTCR